MTPPVCATAVLLAALVSSPAFAVSLRLDASTTWADNISRSAVPADQIDALRHDVQLTASHLQPLATGMSLIATANAGGELVPSFLRNSAYLGGASVTLRNKFGLGAFAPVFAAEVGLQRREARIAGDTGWLASGAVILSKRFTTSLRASFTGDWEQHYAAHSTFDVRHHRAFAAVTWDLTDRWQLSGGHGSLWGDFVASASGATWWRALGGLISPAVTSYYRTISSEVTDAYGSGWVSYRVTGRSDFWWLELSPALGPNTSLPLRYESDYTVNRAGVEYEQYRWTLGVLHRF
jgi:hypothetical protein